MRLLVDLVYYLAAPFFLVLILIRSRLFTRRRYRAGLAQKLGCVRTLERDRPRLLVHAVSVGEVRTALPLLRAFRERFAGWAVVLSTSTDTGYDAAIKGIDGEDDVAVVYYPLDISWAVRRWLRAIDPDLVVLVELELWPNFLLTCRRHDIPVLVANGRLTARAHGRYRAVGRPARFLFSLPTAFAVQNPIYADRFTALGVPRDRLEILGNLKFDIPVAKVPSAAETRQLLRWNDPGSDRAAPLVIMGSCTHPGEETVLLREATTLRQRHGDLAIILAPRHIERASQVVQEARGAGLGPVVRWSEARDGASATGEPAVPPRVLVVDMIGELDRLYPVADVIFVGGSLIGHGGHNMLEPARHGKPVLFGPSVYNFEDIARHLLERDAALSVADAAVLGTVLAGLIDSASRRAALGTRALEASGELRGALGRHLEWLSWAVRQA